MTSLERDRVLGPHPAMTGEIALIDRSEEMKLLKEAVERAIQGEGGVVFLQGEAGIGKTRLARELGAYAHLRGMRVLYGRCPALFRMDGVPPYILWCEVIRDYLRNSRSEQLYRVIGSYPAEVAKLVPELGQKLGAFFQSFSISPEQEQNRLFEAVSQFITNISQEAPLLVALDDLQWTDPSSLLLFHYLARGIQKTPLLLLGAYRSTDIDAKHPLTPILTELNRERLSRSVSLKRMTLDDISEMTKQILEQSDIPPEFCKMIYEKTRGNPFFAEEVINSLKEEDVIYREESKWKIKEISRIDFPEAVKSVVKARIDRLDDECQKVLTMASLVGDDFSFEILRKIISLDESNLRKILDGLLKTGLLKHRVVRGEDMCSFADTIVRDVIYEEVGTFERKQLHSFVGTSLEKAYTEEIDDHVGELAFHFLEGGDKEKALTYFLKAAEKAMKVHANAEAISYFQSALELLEEKEGEYRERARVLERLGDIKRNVGEYDLCLKHWDEALLLWKQHDQKEKTAELYRKMAVTFWRDVGNTEQAQENFQKALKILEAEPESTELASLYAAMASMSYFTEDVAKARSWAERALELAKKLNSSEVTAGSYNDLGLVFGAEGDTKGAVECTEKALKIALDNSYVEEALRAYNNLAYALPTEEHERKLDYFGKGLELARKAGHIDYMSWFEGQLAAMHFSIGNFDKALALVEEYDALSRKIGNLFNLSDSTLMLGDFYHKLGEWNKAERYLKESLSTSLKTSNTDRIWLSYLYLGWLYHDRGEFAKAKECFDKRSEIWKKTEAEFGRQMYYYQWIIMNYIELGEIDKARALLDDLHKFAHEKQDTQLIANEDAARAVLLRAEKKWSESIRLFEKSLQEHEALGARQWNIYRLARYILYEYARVYLERDQPGDRQEARTLLKQALEMFQKMMAKKDIEKTEARIAFIETGQVSVPKPIEPISTGYADLDKLLCGGLPPDRAVVLTSPSCDERDMLVRNFLETGANRGEVTFYVTTDPGSAKTLAEEFQSNFSLFVCNAQADAIVKDMPNVLKSKGVENLTEIGISLTSAINELDSSLKGPRRVCIDLVSDILLQHHAVQTRRWLSALIPELRSEGFTILAIMDPEMHSSQETRAVLDLFDGEISIYERETEKGSDKYLKIKKMSNLEYLEDELPLKE